MRYIRLSISRGNKYIQGKVQKRGNNETFVPDSKFKNELLSWRVNYAPIAFEKSYRYLAIIENSGKLDWAKVNNNQITFFGKNFTAAHSLSVKSKLLFNIDVSYDITFNVNWDVKTLGDYNLEILLTVPGGLHQKHSGCRLIAWFDLKHLRINFSEIEYFDLFGLKDWIEENESKVKEILEEQFLQSFRYKEKNLQGVEADDFLHFWKKYKLTVGEIEKRHLLIFSEVS